MSEKLSEKLQMPNFWVYILFCKNNSLYVGYTNNLNRRYKAHVQGLAAKYTRSFPPLSMAFAWPIYGKKGQAMLIENFIKKMNKKQKKNLIENPSRLEKLIIEQSHFVNTL
jgi:putative endonuclease